MGGGFWYFFFFQFYFERKKYPLNLNTRMIRNEWYPKPENIFPPWPVDIVCSEIFLHDGEGKSKQNEKKHSIAQQKLNSNIF